MSTAKNDGGPAFPVPDNNGNTRMMGMSLRDWFAGQALAGYLANPQTTAHPAYSRDGLVGECYHIADAMLEARK